MKALLVYVSYHHNNTEKIAQKIASKLGAETKKLSEVQPEGLAEFDLVGFGSGIYYGKVDKALFEFANRLPLKNGKKAFIFSTSGVGGKGPKFHEKLKEALTSKGFDVVKEFNCQGFDTYGALRLIGGVSKGRPNEADFKQAEEFGLSLKDTGIV